MKGYNQPLSGKKDIKFSIGLSKPSFEQNSGPIKGLYSVTENDGHSDAERMNTTIDVDDYRGFRQSMLPSIKTRKLEDLDDAVNPFKVNNSAE